MESLLDTGSIPPESIDGVMAVAIAAGMLYCFLGYRAFKFVLGLTGFVLAGATAAVIAAALSGNDLVAMGIAGGIGGLSGAMALFFLYRLGVFGVAALGASVTALHILQGRPETWVVWAIIGVGVGGGLLALILERPIVTLTTGLLGAWFAVYGLAHFLMGPDFLIALAETPELSRDQILLMVVWVLLALLGVVTQFATYRKKEEPPPAKA